MKNIEKKIIHVRVQTPNLRFEDTQFLTLCDSNHDLHYSHMLFNTTNNVQLRFCYNQIFFFCMETIYKFSCLVLLKI